MLIENDARLNFGVQRGAALKPDAEVLEALLDDLNTYKALDRLYHLGEAARTSAAAAQSFVGSLDLLGLQGYPPQLSKVDESAVLDLITARLEARKSKDWKESDRIRDELAAMGIAIKDNKDGTTSWEVKR